MQLASGATAGAPCAVADPGIAVEIGGSHQVMEAGPLRTSARQPTSANLQPLTGLRRDNRCRFLLNSYAHCTRSSNAAYTFPRFSRHRQTIPGLYSAVPLRRSGLAETGADGYQSNLVTIYGIHGFMDPPVLVLGTTNASSVDSSCIWTLRQLQASSYSRSLLQQQHYACTYPHTAAFRGQIKIYPISAFPYLTRFSNARCI